MNGSFPIVYKMKNTNTNAYCFYSRGFAGNRYLPGSKDGFIALFPIEWLVEKNTWVCCGEAALG